MRLFQTFLCCLLSASISLADEVYNAATARADAEKVVRAIDQGKFSTAVTAPLADNPKALALAMKAVNEKKPASTELSMIKSLRKEFTPIRERTWVETRRVNFPLFTVPKYRVTFHGVSPKGKVTEEVLLSRRIANVPDRSHVSVDYSCKLATP